MGLPIYGIQTSPAQRIIQDLAPEEGMGALRAVPFDQLQPGVYEVGGEVPRDLCPDIDYGCPDLTAVFKEYDQRIMRAATDTRLPAAQRLPNAEGVMLIEDWQQDLRKITMRIGYDDPNDATNRINYERHIYLHRDRGGE
jgi:hypothetical protein